MVRLNRIDLPLGWGRSTVWLGTFRSVAGDAPTAETAGDGSR